MSLGAAGGASPTTPTTPPKSSDPTKFDPTSAVPVDRPQSLTPPKFDPDAFLSGNPTNTASVDSSPPGVAWTPPEVTNSTTKTSEPVDYLPLVICLSILGCFAGCWWWLLSALRSGIVPIFKKTAGIIVLGAAVLCLSFPYRHHEYSRYHFHPQFFATAGDQINWSWTVHGFLWLSSIFIGVSWALRAFVAWYANRRKNANLRSGSFWDWIISFTLATAVVAVTTAVLTIWAEGPGSIR